MSTIGDEVADLDRRWKHACDVATASIGQPDRADNVAYRDELAAKLSRARVRAGLTL